MNVNIAPFGKRSRELVLSERRAVRQAYKKIILAQGALLTLWLIITPTYVLPLIENERALPWAIGIICTEAFLIYAHEMLSPTSKWGRVSLYVITFVFGIFPGLLLPLCGPAIITVTNALNTPACYNCIGRQSDNHVFKSQEK